MAILSNLPAELEYYGVKWSIFYSNLQGKRIDMNIYKKDFTGTSLCTETEIDLCTEAGDILTPGTIYIEHLLASEDELYLLTEDAKQLSLGITAAKTGKETALWAEILYDHIGVMMNQSFSDGDLFKPVSGTAFQLQFHDISGHDFDELFHAKNYQYYFELQVDYVVMGLGYLLPETIQKDYGALPQTINILAVDGLGLLKDIPFKHNDGKDITGIEKLSDIFTFLFHKAGLRTTWLDKINIKPQGTSSFAMDTYIECELWKDQNCGTVLDDLMSMVNGQACSYKDMFILRQLNEPSSGYAIRYNWDGSTTSPLFISSDLYVLQDKAEYDGRGLLSVEKPLKSLNISYSRELIEDLSIDWPVPTLVENSDIPPYQWPGAWIYDNKRVTIFPVQYPTAQSLIGTIGVLLDWDNKYRYDYLTPGSPVEVFVAVKFSFKLNFYWEGMHTGTPRPPLPAGWFYYFGLRVFQDDENTHGFYTDSWGTMDMENFREISYNDGWQDLEFVYYLDLTKHIKIQIPPMLNVPTSDLTMVDVECKWEVYISEDGEGNPYDSDTLEYPVELVTENKVERSVSKTLGASPHPLSHAIWKNALLKKIDQKYIGADQWTKAGVNNLLRVWIENSYKKHYLTNKYRYSIAIFNMDEVAEITPFTIIRDLNINQDFIILSMQYVPKLNRYALELIGFEI